MNITNFSKKTYDSIYSENHISKQTKNKNDDLNYLVNTIFTINVERHRLYASTNHPRQPLLKRNPTKNQSTIDKEVEKSLKDDLAHFMNLFPYDESNEIPLKDYLEFENILKELNKSENSFHEEFKIEEIEDLLKFLKKDIWSVILDPSGFSAPTNLFHEESISVTHQDEIKISENFILLEEPQDEINSKFSKNAFDTSKISQEINQANKMEVWLQDIFRILIAYNCIDAVLEVANQAPNVSVKEMIIRCIAKALFDKINIKQALDVANQVTDVWTKEMILYYVSMELADKAKIYKALQAAHKTDDEQRQPYLKYLIFELIIQNGLMDTAIAIANNMIFDDQLKEKALRHIVNALALGKALKIANKEKRKDDTIDGTLSNIFVKLAYRSYTKAMEIANMIPHNQRSYVLENISHALAQYGNIDKAPEVANMIVDDTIRKNAFTAIFNVLIQRKEFDKAVILAKDISEERIKQGVLVDLSQALLNDEQPEKAKKVINMLWNQDNYINKFKDIFPFFT